MLVTGYDIMPCFDVTNLPQMRAPFPETALLHNSANDITACFYVTNPPHIENPLPRESVTL